MYENLCDNCVGGVEMSELTLFVWQFTCVPLNFLGYNLIALN
jgi:hypothetical protein